MGAEAPREPHIIRLKIRIIIGPKPMKTAMNAGIISGTIDFLSQREILVNMLMAYFFISIFVRGY